MKNGEIPRFFVLAFCLNGDVGQSVVNDQIGVG